MNTMNNFSPILAALLLGQTITAAPDSKASASATDNKLPALIYRSNAVYSILEAAKAGAPDVIEARLKEGDNVNQADEMGNTALHLAARAGSAECVKLLLNAGADTTLPDATGKLASQMAASQKISRMLKSAMAAREEEIALYEKITAGNLDALKAAARKKTFNPDMLDKENKIPLLAQLCLKKDTEGVRLLIKAGANVNYVTSDSRTILHWAIDADHAGIITLLLNAGADKNAKNKDNQTARDMAAESVLHLL